MEERKKEVGGAAHVLLVDCLKKERYLTHILMVGKEDMGSPGRERGRSERRQRDRERGRERTQKHRRRQRQKERQTERKERKNTKAETEAENNRRERDSPYNSSIILTPP
jgi:hypothetical protein